MGAPDIAIATSLDLDGKLIQAAGLNDPAGCHAAIECGAHPDTTDPSAGRSAAAIASAKGHTRCLAVLIKSGANINAAGPDGATPLLLAAKHGHAGCVRLLVGAGADLDATDAVNATAAKRALRHGHASCLALVLAAGATPPSIESALKNLSIEGPWCAPKQAQALLVLMSALGIGDEEALARIEHIDTMAARNVREIIAARRKLRAK